MVKQKKIEEIYTNLSEIDHVLQRSGMWVGSTKEELSQMYVFDDNEGQMTLKDINYVPAMLKIFDEVLSNSCDEYRRETNLGLNRIDVEIHKEGYISIKDNGGIPIVMHNDAGCYVPEFIFGRLRTSSNYNDDESRTLIGTNGVGASLANIFSSKFIIESADGKKSFYRSWSDNMKTLNDDLVVKKCKDHYTKTTFYIDFPKFDINYKEFTDDFILAMEKRCIDAAAANFGLRVNFVVYDKKTQIKKSDWKFKKFDEYIELYSGFVNVNNAITFSDKEKSVWIYPSDNSINVGFVDGAQCSKGTHINAIRYNINKSIQEHLNKKHKIDVTLHNVDQKYSLFCIVDVVNPEYDSQTKECLTTPVDKFSREENYKFTVPDNFLAKTQKSEITNLVLDWYKQKETAEDQRQIRKMNRESGKLLRNDKFINCNSRKVSEKQLWIFEGDSAASGFRQGRDPQTQAGYLMRGVPLNVIGMKPTQVMKNQVLNDIVKILGLKWGERNDKKDLKFNKIVISTDMDFDGHKIAALLMVFFNHFPELYEQKMICRIISPIIIATRGTGKKQENKLYYDLESYRKEQSKLKNWSIKYVKGLGAQNLSQYRQMMQSNHFQYFTKDDISDMMLGKWFGKGIASTRKDMLRDDVEA